MKTIPVPENPYHVKNLESIPLLKAQGFKGQDACLAVSLFEQGLVWRHLDNGEILFVYDSPDLPDRFHRCGIRADVNPLAEWSWVKWGDVAEQAGAPVLTYPAGLPIETVVADLVRHYGTEEVFGSQYWEGFTVAEHEEKGEA